MKTFIVLILFALVAAKNLRKEHTVPRWMLTEEELTKSRAGYKRNDISTYTENNDAEYIKEGSNYMRRLYEDMIRTGDGDFIHGTLFEVTDSIMLMPNANDTKNSKKTALKQVLTDAVKRGVKVRLLVNCNLVYYFSAVSFCIRMNFACGYTCCGIDTRHHNWIMGNLHTKMWIIKVGDETVAYNGGIDITKGRWDTAAHVVSKEREMNGDFYWSCAYHDSAMRMKGPIVVDYERHFHQSWNDPYPAFFPLQNLPKYNWAEPPHKLYTEKKLDIQLLRTLGCKGAKKGFYQNAAPIGEYSSTDGLKKLIMEAKEFLYLEDQFFNYPDIMEVVKKRLPALKFVIITTTNQGQPAILAHVRYYQQHKALKLLKEDPEQGKKVFIFSLVREKNPKEMIYLHSKLFIADDEYIITGSFGVERSGLTNDREAGMGIYDHNGKFVKGVRKSIWAEHLLLNEDNPILDDPFKALEEWKKQGAEANKRVRNYFPKALKWNILCDIFDKIFEAEGRC